MADSKIYTRLELDVKNFTSGLNLSQSEAEKFSAGMERIMARYRKQLNGLERRGRKGTGLGSVLTSEVAKFASWGAAVGTATAAVKDAIETTMQFERSLSGLSALTGATGDDLEYIRRQAIEMSTQSELSAQEIVEAMKLIGGQRAELLDCADGLAAVTKAVITLSMASETDLESAARAVTGALGQFGKGAEYAASFVNVLAAGSAEGAAEVPYLQDAVERAGSSAAAAGLSFEQLVAVIEGVAPRFTSAEQAGTSLRNIFTILESQADDRLKPSIVGIHDALDNLAAMELSTAEITQLFGKQNINMARALMEARGEIRGLEQAVTDTHVAEEMAAVQTDNLQGAVKELSNSWDAFVLTLNRSDGALASAVRWVSELVKGMRELVSSADELRGQRATDKATKGISELNERLVARQEGRYVDKWGENPGRQDRAEALKAERKYLQGRLKLVEDFVGDYEEYMEDTYGEDNLTYDDAGNIVGKLPAGALEKTARALHPVYNIARGIQGLFDNDPVDWTSADKNGTDYGKYQNWLEWMQSYQQQIEYVDQLLAEENNKRQELHEGAVQIEDEGGKALAEAAAKNAEKERKEREAALEKLGKRLEESRAKVEDGEVAAMEEGAEKMRAKARLAWKRGLEDIDKREAEAKAAARAAGVAYTEEMAAVFDEERNIVNDKALRAAREAGEKYGEALADGVVEGSKGLADVLEEQGLSLASTYNSWQRRAVELHKLLEAYKSAIDAGTYGGVELTALGHAVREQRMEYGLSVAGTANYGLASVGGLAESLGLDGLSEGIGEVTGFIGSLIGTIEAVMAVIQMVQGIISGGQIVAETANTAALAANTAALAGMAVALAANTAGMAALGVALAANTATSWLPFQRGGVVPRYEQGGRITGSRTTGDRLLARVNAGEMVLTRTDQSRLLASMRGGGAGGGGGTTTVRGEDIYLSLSAYMRRTGKSI